MGVTGATEVDSMVMGGMAVGSASGSDILGTTGILMGILMGTTGTTGIGTTGKRTGMSSAALKLWRIRVTRTG